MVGCLMGGCCPKGSVVRSVVAAGNTMPTPSMLALMSQTMSVSSPPIALGDPADRGRGGIS